MSSHTTPHTTGKPNSGPGSERITPEAGDVFQAGALSWTTTGTSLFRSRTGRCLDALATVTVFSDYLAASNAVVALIHIFYKAKQGRKEMLSSTSGFQRLSQAALSRSRFLQLAAGALVPFVGLPPAAVRAQKPALAH